MSSGVTIVANLWCQIEIPEIVLSLENSASAFSRPARRTTNSTILIHDVPLSTQRTHPAHSITEAGRFGALSCKTRFKASLPTPEGELAFRNYSLRCGITLDPDPTGETPVPSYEKTWSLLK